MVIIKRGQLAFEPIDAVEKKLVSIGGDDEARGHRKTGGCQSDEIAPLAADSRYKAGLRLIEVDDQTHKATALQSSTRCDFGCGERRCSALMYRKFKPPFFWPAIAQDRQSCQSHFCLMKNPLLCRSAWPESSREASERFLMETLGKNYRPIRQHSGSSRRALQTGRGASTDTHSDSRCCCRKSLWSKAHHC